MEDCFGYNISGRIPSFIRYFSKDDDTDEFGIHNNLPEFNSRIEESLITRSTNFDENENDNENNHGLIYKFRKDTVEPIHERMKNSMSKGFKKTKSLFGSLSENTTGVITRSSKLMRELFSKADGDDGDEYSDDADDEATTDDSVNIYRSITDDDDIELVRSQIVANSIQADVDSGPGTYEPPDEILCLPLDHPLSIHKNSDHHGDNSDNDDNIHEIEMNSIKKIEMNSIKKIEMTSIKST